MRKIVWLWVVLLLTAGMTLEVQAAKKPAKKTKVENSEVWPDGTPMDAWFRDTTKVDLATLGKQYVVSDYGVVMGSSEV